METGFIKVDRKNDQSRHYPSKAYLQVGKPRGARNDLTDLSAKNYLDSRQLLESPNKAGSWRKFCQTVTE
jgi:hypothetical protein